MARKTTTRNAGRFTPGYSGNPLGRPRDIERRKRFIEAYIGNFYRGAKAAREVGVPPSGARVAACRMLRESVVRMAIQQHFKQLARERFERERAEELAWQAWMAARKAKLRTSLLG